MVDQSVIPCKLFARDLIKRSIVCLISYLVSHSSRMPEVIKARLPNHTPDEWSEGYQISVTDVRQVIDWAGSQPEVNKTLVTIIGISLGGFISARAMEIDRRITAGIFLVSGYAQRYLAMVSPYSP